MSNHPRPCITADVLLYRNNQFEGTAQKAEILLIERGKDPFKGCWALPGGHFDVDNDESILHCAIREIKEETNLDVSSEELEYIGYFDAKGRDPRGRYVGFAWAFHWENDEKPVAGDDAAKVGWFALDKLPELSFDHKNIIQTWIDH